MNDRELIDLIKKSIKDYEFTYEDAYNRMKLIIKVLQANGELPTPLR